MVLHSEERVLTALLVWLSGLDVVPQASGSLVQFPVNREDPWGICPVTTHPGETRSISLRVQEVYGSRDSCEIPLTQGNAERKMDKD